MDNYTIGDRSGNSRGNLVQQKTMDSGKRKVDSEGWRIIKGHPNYEVSDCGRIRSKSRLLVNRNGIRRFWKTRVLSPSLGGSNYFCIVLDGRGLWVHKLVAEALVSNPDNKQCVNHIDEDKNNNMSGNLEWVTHQENMNAFMKAAGNCELRGNMKLTKRQIEVIHSRFGKESDKLIADEYGVCKETISRLRRGVGLFLKSGPGQIRIREKEVVI